MEAKSDPDISATMRKIKKLRSRGASVAEKDTGVIRQTPQTYLTTDVHFVLGEKFKVRIAARNLFLRFFRMKLTAAILIGVSEAYGPS